MIPLFALAAGTGQVLTLDDPTATDDIGTPYTATLVSVGFEAGAWSGFRRVVQEVHLGATATLSFTPIADGTLGPSQVAALSTTANGEQVPVTVAFGMHGTRHQLMVSVIGHTGSVELGAWRRHLVPRRTERGS